MHVEEDTGRPVAYSYDPESLKTEAIKTILEHQIQSENPLEIHCYVRGTFDIGGVFKTIEADEFKETRNLDEQSQNDFVRKKMALLKGPDTFDIIFSEPLDKVR